MNWDDTRIFLALTRDNTLRAAARQLGVDQATVGRRIAAMERELGATLFLRASDGYVLTQAGESALAAARRMEAAALELQQKITGQDDTLSGTVRVTSTDSLAVDFLIPAVAELHALHPNIRVDLEVSTQVVSLARRQADLAIRTVKPENPELFMRRLVQWPVALYASQFYLDARGWPSLDNEFAGHDLVVYKPYLEGGRALSMADESTRQGQLVATFNSSLLIRKAVAAGLGIGEMPTYMGEREGLVRLWPGRARKTPYDVWLVTHPDLRTTARIRTVAEHLAAAFRSAKG